MGGELGPAVSLCHDTTLKRSAGFSADSITARQYSLFALRITFRKGRLALTLSALSAAFLMASLYSPRASSHSSFHQSVGRKRDRFLPTTRAEPLSTSTSLCA